MSREIVVRSEKLPRAWAAAKDSDFNVWWLLKRPPCKELLSWLIDPIGLEPFFDILVAGDGDEAGVTSSNAFGEGGGSDFSYVTVDDRGKLVKDGEDFVVCECECEGDSELFAGGEELVGSQPGRRAGEAYGAEEFDEGFNWDVWEGVQYRLSGVPALCAG